MPTLTYGSTEIIYSVKHSRQRQTLEIAVDPEEGVVVTCPSDVSERRIEKEVLKKAPWILKKLNERRQVVQVPPEREYISGETYHYLGRRYRLKVIEDKSVHPFSIKLVRGRLQVRVPPDSFETPRDILVQSALLSWYMKLAEPRLRERIEFYASKVGVKIPEVIVKNQMKRWGTCTKDGVVYLNWRIIMAPLSIIDYVIVHELVHRVVPSHAKDFWQRIEMVLPDYKRRKEWLRINGPTLIV